MEGLKIYLSVKENNISEKSLDINLKVSGISKEAIKLYKGNINVSNISCTYKYNEENNFIEVLKSDNLDLVLNYTVNLGSLGKHGHTGELNENILAFSGEHIFILPVNILSLKDYYDGYCDFIKISFDIKNKKLVHIPFMKEENTLNINNPVWSDIYKLMKDNYIFGNFKECYKKDSLKIFTEENINIEDSVKENIYNLYSYYTNLFEIKKDLNIVLLNKNKYDNENILGGCVGDSICASFDFNKLRDLQLLSHRLFHNFMDFKIRTKAFHMMPNLWLTEGLATYYENVALESLNDDFKKDININSDKEFKKIFLRYLYMRIKNRELLNIAPMEEGSIKSYGKIEFLHYTIAPLIIKLIEDIRYKSIGEKDSIIKYINSLDYKNGFYMDELFIYLLGDNRDKFAISYLFNSEILPLWYLDYKFEDASELIDHINEYEYVLWTWFNKEGIDYKREFIKLYDVDKKYETLANNLNINFGDKLFENMVKKSSNTIYTLLKKYYLELYITNSKR